MTASSLQNLVSTTIWTPPSSLVNHKGDALDSKVIFFAPPPPEIGQVLSAYSELAANQVKKTKPDVSLLHVGLMIMLLFVSVGFWMIIGTHWTKWIPVVLSIIAGGYFWLNRNAGVRPVTCTYVATQGVARYVWDDDERKRLTPALLRFRDATELRVSETHDLEAGAYKHAFIETVYKFVWTNGSEPAYAIDGIYRRPKSTLPTQDPQNPYHFALAAEKAWTAFLWERSLQQLALGSTVNFEIKNGDTFTLSRDAIELRCKGETICLGRADEPFLRAGAGLLSLYSKHTIPSSWGVKAKGSYHFKYFDVANVQLLLLLFNTLMKR